MAKEYIDTKYLFQCETCHHHKSGKCDTWCENGENYRPDMSKIPIADVTEIVRCEDCKYIHGPQYGIGYCYPEDSASYRVVSLDDFCKYGKRRDKESESNG